MAAPVRIRLKGLGLPARGSRTAGHLFVTLTPSSDAPSAAEDLLVRFTRVWTPERLAA
jgi:curved DNA-binding protein